MSPEKIREIFSGDTTSAEEVLPSTDSTGIGLRNVIRRLELYYEQEGLTEIRSGGENQGTEVIIRIPWNH